VSDSDLASSVPDPALGMEVSATRRLVERVVIGVFVVVEVAAAVMRSFVRAAWVVEMVVLRYYRRSRSSRFRHQRLWMAVLVEGRVIAGEDIVGSILDVEAAVMRTAVAVVRGSGKGALVVASVGIVREAERTMAAGQALVDRTVDMVVETLTGSHRCNVTVVSHKGHSRNSSPLLDRWKPRIGCSDTDLMQDVE